MVMKVEAARWLVYRAATLVEDGMVPPLPTSIAKGYCSIIAVEVCDAACQILGAFGFTRESDTEWRYRWARILGPVGAGAIEIQKVRIVSELLGRRFDQRAR
jgi:alkylation response protein AidB-like acyl-CoA dehydrogenase